MAGQGKYKLDMSHQEVERLLEELEEVRLGRRGGCCCARRFRQPPRHSPSSRAKLPRVLRRACADAQAHACGVDHS